MIYGRLNLILEFFDFLIKVHKMSCQINITLIFFCRWFPGAKKVTNKATLWYVPFSLQNVDKIIEVPPIEVGNPFLPWYKPGWCCPKRFASASRACVSVRTDLHREQLLSLIPLDISVVDLGGFCARMWHDAGRNGGQPSCGSKDKRSLSTKLKKTLTKHRTTKAPK